MKDRRKKKQVKKKVQQIKKINFEIPSEWLYVVQEKVSLHDLYDDLKEKTCWRTEYWGEAEVLEIGIPKAGSVDLEFMDLDSEDEELLAYMDRHEAKAIYAVTVVPEYYTEAQAVMRYIVKKFGGLFCADTADFLPEVSEVPVTTREQEDLQNIQL